MATAVRTALNSLLAEFPRHETFGLPNPVQQRRSAAILRAGELSGRLGAQTSQTVADALTAATAAVATANYGNGASVDASVATVNSALDRLAALLG